MVLNSIFYIGLLFLVSLTGFSQKAYYFINFKDKIKNDVRNSLSEKSITRRSNQSIAFEYSDYPVIQTYITKTVSFKNTTPVITSKWLNGILLLTDSNSVKEIKLLPFVKSAEWVSNQEVTLKRNALLECKNTLTLDYGNAAYQVQTIKADKMHDICLDGNGIYIAVFDGGFTNSNQLASLNHIFQQNRLKFTFNIVDHNSEVYIRNTHGTNVLSCMAGYMPGKLIGTGYGAEFALFICEDVKSEKRIEEYYWLKAAEMADSIGVDIISSSLGYYSFDDSAEDHKLSELDGKTAVISQAAALAARKGILVVSSAGNNYSDNKWRNIVFPSDADSILAVGAVDNQGLKASFSAIGPTSDGRIKPDVSVFGSAVIVNSSTNSFTSATGTSYSAPLLSGLAAGLWQSNRSITNIQLRNAIIQSSSKGNDPDNEIGHGVPDFVKAYFIINKNNPFSCDAISVISENIFYPNPVNDLLTIQLESIPEGTVYFLNDINGKELMIGKVGVGSLSKLKLDLLSLQPGIYFLRIGERLQKFVKI